MCGIFHFSRKPKAPKQQETAPQAAASPPFYRQHGSLTPREPSAAAHKPSFPGHSKLVKCPKSQQNGDSIPPIQTTVFPAARLVRGRGGKPSEYRGKYHDEGVKTALPPPKSRTGGDRKADRYRRVPKIASAGSVAVRPKSRFTSGSPKHADRTSRSDGIKPFPKAGAMAESPTTNTHARGSIATPQ